MATAGLVSQQSVIRRIDGEYGIWRSDGHPMTVEYRLDVLEEIRAAVAEAFRAVPRGGLETGGVLYGRQEGNLLQITAHRPLECEHAFGPAFVLSPRDEAGLAALLDKPDLQVVGWYHSHTRSEIFLNPQDLEIHDRYFPAAWQVALVLKPQQHGPARAAFFFRANGTSGPEPNDEFVVQPYRAPQPRPAARTEPRLSAVAPKPPEPVRPSPAPVSPDRADRQIRHSSANWGWLALALAVVFAGAAMVARGYLHRASEPTPPILLRAVDNNGQLEVLWDRAAKPVREAERAIVEIKDGGHALTLPLDAEHVRSGSLTYARRSGRVDVRLRVFRPEAGAVEEVASFLGQPVPPPGDQQAARERDEAIQERDQALKDAESLRAALRSQIARNTQLSEAVRVLRRRLDVAYARRRR